MAGTEIIVKLLPLTDNIEESENLINQKIAELRKQNYFINSATVSEGVAILLIGRNVE